MPPEALVSLSLKPLSFTLTASPDKRGKGQSSDFPAVEQHQNAENPHARTDMDKLAGQIRLEAEQPSQRLADDEQAGVA